MLKNILGAGALIDGILILSTQYFGLPSYLNYLWGAFAVVWGVAVFKPGK